MANAEPKNVNLRLERFEYRAVFSKTGRAKYISHLDLMRAFQRGSKGLTCQYGTLRVSIPMCI